MTGARVKNPLSPREAAELCTLDERSVAIGKLLPGIAAYSEVFESAKDLSMVNGEVFDCVLAFTARENVDTICTENTWHFRRYAFLNADNPLVNDV